jgi:hypothetical protein
VSLLSERVNLRLMCVQYMQTIEQTFSRSTATATLDLTWEC